MLIQADSRAIPLADNSVQCVVTSPPYWGLRDYGTARWQGGEGDCNHSVGGQVQDSKAPGAITTGQRPGVDSSRCRKCGARRIDSQIGLEPTPEEYVATMVAVFREVGRVLREDGTVWLNLGDSYSAGGNGGGGSFAKDGIRSAMPGTDKNVRPYWRIGRKAPTGLKPKNLIGIPWRVAFALQADGWYLRSDIIWSKSNPMPESVTDRPTRSHEHLFLLSKSERYFYDADAIRESWADARNGDPGPAMSKYNGSDTSGGQRYLNRTTTAPGCPGRNKRDVWTINSEPFPEAHFATFPKALVEPCVLAGSRPGDIVLDPFMGSGTVGEVCERLGRRWVGLELSWPYIEIARKRTAQRGLRLSEARL